LVAASVAVPAQARSAHRLNARAIARAKVLTKDIKTGDEDVGGTLSCPGGKRILSGGAFFHAGDHVPDQTLADMGDVMSSGPLDRHRWYAAGHSAGGTQTLTIVLRCLPNRRLRGERLLSQDYDVGDGLTGGGAVGCDGNTRILTGGGVWHPRGADPVPAETSRGFLAGSVPGFNARGWFADGSDNYIGDDYLLTESLLCVPKRRIKGVKVITRTFADVPNGSAVGLPMTCPGRTRALTGGGYWHSGDGVPDPSNDQIVYLAGSVSVGARSKGWFVDGFNFASPAGMRSFTTGVLCLRAGR
jgi:hypothetical protein